MTQNCGVFLEMSLNQGNINQTLNLVPILQFWGKPSTVESDIVLCQPLISEKLHVILPVLGKCQQDKDGWKTRCSVVILFMP